MMVENFRIQPMGEQAILIDFEPEVSEMMLKKVLLAKELVERRLFKEKVEVINTYHSLLICYPFTIENVYEQILTIKTALEQPKITKKAATFLFHLPVCYDPLFGLDLDMLSEEKNLPVSRIIELHLQPVYPVFFIGFLPGFLYLGGLEKQLHFPRKNQPRLEVEKGAVGIGGNQTGIYPNFSPGGWQIIGNFPGSIFDPTRDPPCEISAGDRVKFYAVDMQEYHTIREAVSRGTFRIKKEVYERED